MNAKASQPRPAAGSLPIDTSVEPPKKQLSRGVKIGRLIEKLEDLDRREKDELANAPASITARFTRMRDEALNKAESEVRAAVEKVRGDG